MDIFLKASALALIVSILYIAVSGHNKEIGALLVICGCAVVFGMALAYIEPIFEFIRQLQNLGNLNVELIEILLKSVGVGLLAEIAILVCNDMGNKSMGKALQIMATSVILWISLPLFTGLLELVGEILGEL